MAGVRLLVLCIALAPAGCASLAVPEPPGAARSAPDSAEGRVRRAAARPVASATPVVEVLATIDAEAPAALAVSRDGRTFVAFRSSAGTPAVAEVLERGTLRAYPGDATRFASVRAVVVDERDRLWVLDAGDGDAAPARLVGIDLVSDRVFETRPLAPEAVVPASVFVSVRFDRSKGGGTAEVLDAPRGGAAAVVVVDLATGRASRRDATAAERGTLDATFAATSAGADGAALAADGVHGTLRRRAAGGVWEVVASDPRLEGASALCAAGDGAALVTATGAAGTARPFRLLRVPLPPTR